MLRVEPGSHWKAVTVMDCQLTEVLPLPQMDDSICRLDFFTARAALRACAVGNRNCLLRLLFEVLSWKVLM